jgi:hypothetical protein
MRSGIREHQIQAVSIQGKGTLAHAIANDFPSTDFYFVSVLSTFRDQVAFRLDEKVVSASTQLDRPQLGRTGVSVLLAGEVKGA